LIRVATGCGCWLDGLFGLTDDTALAADSEKAFGAKRTTDMRALLRAVAATDLGPTAITVAE
jgi:hypothetical protein